jgi:hypothetical protein
VSGAMPTALRRHGGVLLLPRRGICGLAADSRLPQQGA